ncbi:hypothetical protein ROLI_016690 [Roseobacter fucihabitans]|uniref:Molybdopterin-guanine dinucleotide biosynthesis protein A n=1 Tax=Roseobacter fucihabitans TaxID=1537242 RepID=A0ABZ2BRI7_9RHOB|nr:DUF3305 domain-containing protein [Roseobacter litoralis]MBC6964456.1 hypothetical protein [Roseobacter litoralis]
MGIVYPNSQSVKLGVVLRRSPGVTAWVRWAWKATAVLPGAPQASWKILRQEGDVTEYHASTHDLTLYVSDTEAYAHELQAEQPSVYVVLRPIEVEADAAPWNILHVTASPYEAQDYCDSGEETVERVEMPAPVLAWVSEFVEQFHVEEEFVKRRRDRLDVDRKDHGIGDARISQVSDVYRAPTVPPRGAPE